MKIYNIGPDELSKWDIGQIDIELDWIVVFYENYGYEGSGEAVGYRDGKLYVKNLGHCSCYGPVEDGFGEFSVEDFREALDSIHSYIDTPGVEEKVLELLG